MSSFSARHFLPLVLFLATTITVTDPLSIAASAQPVRDETVGSAGPTTTGRAGTSHVPLPLSVEDRHRVYEGLTPYPDLHSAGALDVADRVPGATPLQDLPATVTSEIPLLRGHKFMKLADRILLVDPASRVVVAMIPRYKLLP